MLGQQHPAETPSNTPHRRREPLLNHTESLMAGPSPPTVELTLTLVFTGHHSPSFPPLALHLSPAAARTCQLHPALQTNEKVKAASVLPQPLSLQACQAHRLCGYGFQVHPALQTN